MAEEKATLLNGNAQITDDGVYVFPVDLTLTGEDIQGLIQYHESRPHEKFKKAMSYYKGRQAIADLDKRPGFRPDNRLTINYAAYNVDTFNGFFAGIPPKISLDEPKANTELQDWHNSDDFVDQFSELSKQADIYGRSYLLVYQNEDGDTRTAVVNPERSFMIYDDTVARHTLAFVSYAYDDKLCLTGTVYTKEGSYSFKENVSLDEAHLTVSIYNQVPAVEFVENEERHGINDNVMSLLDALNKAQSQKANQVEYFDNAYLKILGINLDADGDGKPDLKLDGNQMFYSPDADATTATVDFISKPDGDTMQEHQIDRLIEQIHQIAMVPNMNDEAFSGNSSGVALEYKLLPMRNKAVTKARKFTPALRKVYSIVFGQATNVLTDPEAWKDLKFQFSQNVPHNLADEAETAKNLVGIASTETILSTLSVVDDPQAEIKRLDDEKQQSASVGLAAMQNAVGATTDAQKAGVGDGEED